MRAVPAYFSDAANWGKLKSQIGGIGLVVFNPNTGPGMSKDAAWVDRLNSLNGAVRVVGYVDISYGARDSATVLAEIDKYRTWYGTSSIFVDQVTWNCDTVPILQAIVQKVHSNGGLVVLNPGTMPQSCVLDLGDVVVSFEGSASQYKGVIAANPAGYAPSRFWHLIYESAPSEHRFVEELARSRGAGYVYVSSDPMPNPWSRVESFPSTPIGTSALPIPNTYGTPTPTPVPQPVVTYSSQVSINSTTNGSFQASSAGTGVGQNSAATSGNPQITSITPANNAFGTVGPGTAAVNGGGAKQPSVIVTDIQVNGIDPARTPTSKVVEVKVVPSILTQPGPSSSELDLFASPVFSGPSPANSAVGPTVGPATAGGASGTVPVGRAIGSTTAAGPFGGAANTPPASQPNQGLGPKVPVGPTPAPTLIVVSGTVPDRLALAANVKSPPQVNPARAVVKSTTTTRFKSKVATSKSKLVSQAKS